jgi:hypothetical protein
MNEKDKDSQAVVVPDSTDGTSRAPPIISRLLVRALVDSSVTFSLPFITFTTRWFKTAKESDDRNTPHIQFKLLQELTASGIDPRLFDLMLSNELDRNLKRQFGVAFFMATIFFTIGSFAVIILNSIFKWGISDLAITTLIKKFVSAIDIRPT